MLKLTLLIAFISFGYQTLAQDMHVEMDTVANKEGRSLGEVLQSGRVDFHVRNFFMQTINRGDLLDYNSLAFGAGLGYYSPSFKGFHVGFSGFFVFQVFENNIRIPDPTTGNINRYEILLYDMNDVDNTRDLDRLEHLYVSYLRGGLQVVLGRQSINTPLLNEQDNRMRPNTFSGLTLKYSKNDWQLSGAWFTRVTMRGTVDWYSIENSFGVYPFGRNPFGENSSYRGNISSRGIGILGLSRKFNERNQIQLWNYTVENVFNTTFLQGDYSADLGNMNLDLGIQGFYQLQVGNGGNLNPTLAYIMPNENTFGMGGKIGIHDARQSFSLNILGISDQGRFLFPREWGRERFYVSLPRERFEGNGGVMALTAKYDLKIRDSPFKAGLGVSSVRNPDISLLNLNKYGVPSYYHFMGELDYKFKGYLKGVDLKLLVVNKMARNGEVIPDRFRINRVDMWNINLIMDYRF